MNANKNINFQFQGNEVSKISITLSNETQDKNASIIFSIAEFCRKMKIEHQQLIAWLNDGRTVHLGSNFLSCPSILKEFIAKYVVGNENLASVIPFEKYSIRPRSFSSAAKQSALNLEMVNGNSVYSSPISDIKSTTGHLIETRSGINVFLAIVNYGDGQPDTVFYNHSTPEFLYRSWIEVRTLIERFNGPILQMKPVFDPFSSRILARKHKQMSDLKTAYKTPLQFGGNGDNFSIKAHVFGNPPTTTIHGGYGAAGCVGNFQFGEPSGVKMPEGGQAPICFTGKVMGSPTDYKFVPYKPGVTQVVNVDTPDEPKRRNISVVKRDRTYKTTCGKETYGDSYFAIKVREPFIYEEIDGSDVPGTELLGSINELTGLCLAPQSTVDQRTADFLLGGEYTIIEHRFGNFTIGGRGSNLTDLIFPNPLSPNGIPLINLKLGKVLFVVENKNTGHLLICCSEGINANGKIMYCMKPDGDNVRKKYLYDSIKNVFCNKQ